MKIMKKSKAIFIFVAVLAVVVLAVSVVILPPKQSDKDKSVNVGKVAEILSGDKLSSDLVKLEEYRGVIKIDLITPGLDTYGLKVILYDEKNEKILSETDIGEGMWSSGLTDNGFYLVDQRNKKLTVYGRDGDEKFTKTFKTEEAWSSACGLSRDEKLFAFTTLLSGNAYVADLNNDIEKLISTEIFATDFVGAINNKFYLRSVDGDLLALSEDKCEVSVIDNRLSEFSPELCIGYGEYNFVSVFSEDNKLLFLPINSVDEMIVAYRGKRFATSVIKKDVSVITDYNLEKGEYITTEIKDSIRNIAYTEDGRFIIVSGTPEKSKLQIINIESANAKKISFQDKDIPLASQEIFENPSANTANTDKLIKNVPLIHQFPEFPTGCESVSAVMALKYYGENITVTRFIDDYLPKSRDFYFDGDIKYGPDPYRYFIGDPKTAASFGCMAPVIETALKNYLDDDSRVVNTTGKKLNELCSDYIDKDIPVLVWATIGMLETQPINSWYLSDNKRFTWPGNEHCLLLVGYDEGNYYFNDPYSGKCISFEKSLCDDRYGELGMQSIVIMPQ